MILLHRYQQVARKPSLIHQAPEAVTMSVTNVRAEHSDQDALTQNKTKTLTETRKEHQDFDNNLGGTTSIFPRL